jgi:HEAT repeat protein
MSNSIENMKQTNDILGLVNILGDKSQGFLAADALVDIGASTVELVVKEMCTTLNLRAHVNAYIAVTKIGSPAITPLINYLEKPETRYRKETAKALGIIARLVDDQSLLASMITPLLNVITDKHPEVQEAVITALGEVGIRSESSEMRSKILESLSYMMSDSYPDNVREAATKWNRLTSR